MKIIKINKKNKPVVQALLEKSSKEEMKFLKARASYEKAYKGLWNKLHELHPEIATGQKCDIDVKKMELHLDDATKTPGVTLT